MSGPCSIGGLWRIDPFHDEPRLRNTRIGERCITLKVYIAPIRKGSPSRMQAGIRALLSASGHPIFYATIKPQS